MHGSIRNPQAAAMLNKTRKLGFTVGEREVYHAGVLAGSLGLDGGGYKVVTNKDGSRTLHAFAFLLLKHGIDGLVSTQISLPSE